MRRRNFLKLITWGGIGVSGGIALRARRVGFLPTDDQPYRLWDQATTSVRHQDLVQAAVLSANPHNSQPWKFRLSDSTIDVHLDRSRALGPVDPVLRQMQIGIGCAIENLCVAARARGLVPSVDLFPDPANPDLAARVTLVPGGTPDRRHADVIRKRHTNRGPYDRERQLPDGFAATLRAQVTSAATTLQLFEAGSDQGGLFSRTILRGTEALIADAEFMRATDSWFRWTPREVSQHSDGPSLRCAGLPPMLAVAAMLGPRQSTEAFDAAWLDTTRDVHLATAPAFGCIAVSESTPQGFIEAGRVWQRIHLEATTAGVGMQPLDQAIEAFERARQIGAAPIDPAPATLALSGTYVAMMFRAGYPLRAAPASARRPLSAVLL